jgi:hypothetical protein
MGWIFKKKDDLIRDYLIDVFDFLSEFKSYNMLISDIGEVDVLYLNPPYTTRAYIFPNIIYKSLVVEKNAIIIKDDCEDVERLAGEVIRYLSSDFVRYIVYQYKGVDRPRLAPSCLSVFGDLQYVFWAIKNVPYFILDKHIINSCIRWHELRSFRVERRGKVIKYEPIIHEGECCFGEEIINLNLSKVLDEEAKLTKYDMLFSGLVMSAYESVNEPVRKNDKSSKRERTNYYQRDSYDKYSGSYAQNVEGLSDDFIDNVLDGDPDAWWNID